MQQILQWLFKGAQQVEGKNNTFNHPTKTEDPSGKNGEGKEINLRKKRGGAYKRTKGIEPRRLCCCNYLKLFAFLYKEDVAAETCFYSTLGLRRLRNADNGNFVAYSAATNKKMMKRGESESGAAAAHAGNNKVLPITEMPPPLMFFPAGSKEYKCAAAAGADTKGDKKKPISRMKELIRWAASAKTEKGGGKLGGRKVSTMFRRRGTPNPDDDQVSNNDSPKISFRCDSESCSTISSVYSTSSIASSMKNRKSQIADSAGTLPPAETGRKTSKGNWITTDEYVVLEL